ncbi:cell wall hydrolase [Limnochorda pilosa]|nr:cell wall hydrolase [Limnochorda pilosa]
MQMVRQGNGRVHTGTRLLACALAVIMMGAPLAGTALGRSEAAWNEIQAPTSPHATRASLGPASSRPGARATASSEEPQDRPPAASRPAVPVPPEDAAAPRAPIPAPSSPGPARPEPRPWYTDRDLDTLARLVHAESEGEPFVGRVAVAAVVLNRVRHSRFPGTIAGVVFQPGAFEPVANGRIWEEPDRLSRQATKAALDGWDPTGGAIYFWNPAKVGGGSWIWQVHVTGQIGQHVFGWR